MTDRELLERAARAAGIAGSWTSQSSPSRSGGGRKIEGFFVRSPRGGYGKLWRPLEDDGDEARLEAALQMHVEWHPELQTVKVGTADVACTEPFGADWQAARRRAGVRAAAAIGGGSE